MLKLGVRIPKWFQICLVLCFPLAATLAMVQRANAQFTPGTPVSPLLIGQSYWNVVPNNVWPMVQAAGANHLIRIGGTGQNNSPLACDALQGDLIQQIQMFRNIGAEPIIQVSAKINGNLATEAAAAAAMVTCVNITNVANGNLAYPVQYWSIGNETDAGFSGTDAQLAADVQAYIFAISPAMRNAAAASATNPNITIMAPEFSFFQTARYTYLVGGAYDITGTDSNGRFYVDEITVHRYPFGNAPLTWAASDVLNEQLSGMPGTLKKLVTVINVANTLNNRTGAHALTYGLTEFNITFTNPSPNGATNFGTCGFMSGQFFATTYGAGMATATSAGQSANNMNTWSVNQSSGACSSLDLGFLSGNPLSANPTARSSYYHMQMTQQYLLSGSKPSYLTPIVDSTSTAQGVLALATVSNSGALLSVMILNENASNSHNFSLRMNSAPVQGPGPTQINVPAGLAAEYSDTIPSQSTMVLQFNAAGILTEKVTYSLASLESNLPPTVVYSANPIPVLASLSLTSGVPGSSVTITGSNFGSTQGSSMIQFGLSPATVTAWSSTSITATVPTLYPGAVNVLVTVGGNLSNLLPYTVEAAPIITSLSPYSGLAGSSITIKGSGFSSTMASNTVNFGSTTATVTNASTTSLTVTVPALSVGPANVSVTVGVSTSNAVAYHVMAAVTVKASSPTVTYGSAVPSITPSYSDFQGVDTSSVLTILPTCVTTYTVTSNVGSSPTTSCSGAVAHDYTFTYVPGSVTVVYPAPLTVTANNATKIYGTANPTFTGSVTGQQNGDTFVESFSTSATITSPVNKYAIVPSVTGTNLAYYTQYIANGTLTVTKAGTATALTVSSGSITPGQSVTLSAQVTSATTDTPTGTVSFYDGTTLLNTASLTAGAASYNTAGLAPGVKHSLSATYSGDANFIASSSTSSVTVTVAPLDFTMTLSGPSTATVVPGSSITYQVSVTPYYGSYAGTVNFAVAGLPPGATVTFSPASIVANGGPQTITVTIQTALATAMRQAPSPPTTGKPLAPFTLAFVLLFGSGAVRRHSRALRRMFGVAVLLVSGATAAMLSGCTSPNGVFTQAPQNYTITISATSGTLQHSTTVTLNVQ